MTEENALQRDVSESALSVFFNKVQLHLLMVRARSPGPQEIQPLRRLLHPPYLPVSARVKPQSKRPVHATALVDTLTTVLSQLQKGVLLPVCSLKHSIKKHLWKRVIWRKKNVPILQKVSYLCFSVLCLTKSVAKLS